MKKKGAYKARKEFYKKRQEIIDLCKNTKDYSIVEIEGCEYINTPNLSGKIS